MCVTRRTALAGLLSSSISPIGLSNPSWAGTGEFKILCSLSNELVFSDVAALRPARPEAQAVMGWICDMIGIRPAFEMREGDFSSGSIAFAAIRGDNQYIVYDAKWFQFEPNTVDWYMVWIFAHEIGHHTHGHTAGFKPNQHEGELNADRFGGWVVARLGGTLEHALSFMPRLSEQGSESHPPRELRAFATAAGWKSGRSIR